MRPRIQTLDGLRFLAALGVLWIHSWTHFGNSRLNIWHLDVASVLAIGGNGVDFFFVISGFCMYYFYAGHRGFSYCDFGRFLFKRWIRLSPAFYTATVVYLLFNLARSGISQTIIPSLITSALYLNSMLTQYNAGGHFWTLGTEWQFYILIPFLLIYQRLIGFRKIFLLIFGVLIALAVICISIFSDEVVDILTNQILFRGIEFGFGIIAARLLLKNFILKKNRLAAFLLSIIITYAGRILISGAAMSLSPRYHNLIKLSGFTIMGAGFAGVLYLAVTSQDLLSKCLSNRVFKTMGRISYSFYLWHGLVLSLCATYIANFQLGAVISPVLTTVVVTVVLYPISYFSYSILEKPFLSKGNLTTK